MEVSIRWARTFLAVYEHGHFGRAAQVLYLTTSAVSKHIRNLERELGATLLVRDAGPTVTPTAAGDAFAATAVALISASDAACAAARTTSAVRTVRLGVLAGVPFTTRQLVDMRAQVATQSPGWQIALRRIRFSAINDSLDSGAVDVLWTAAAPRHRSITSIEVGRLARVGLVAANHPLASAVSVSAETFADQPLLYNPALPAEWMGPFCLDDVRPAGDANLTAVASDDFHAVVEQVVRGTGVVVSAAPPAAASRSPIAVLRLSGLPASPTHAAIRADDRREIVHVAVAALSGALSATYSGPLAQ